jgi:hypothetical protein
MTAVRKLTSLGLCVAGAVALLSAGPAQAQQATMSFFVSSVGGGKGADFGGLAGADKHCQTLAAAVGAGSKTWHAYLSTQGDGAVNARDRIGKGPWSNAKGVVIAKDVAELHGTNNLTKETALTEKAGGVNGYGDRPNQHDILTGSQRDGTAFPPDKDRKGPREDDAMHSWNSSHPSRGPEGGCSQTDLPTTGGAGLLYCFAVN